MPSNHAFKMEKIVGIYLGLRICLSCLSELMDERERLRHMELDVMNLKMAIKWKKK